MTSTSSYSGVSYGYQCCCKLRQRFRNQPKAFDALDVSDTGDVSTPEPMSPCGSVSDAESEVISWLLFAQCDNRFMLISRFGSRQLRTMDKFRLLYLTQHLVIAQLHVARTRWMILIQNMILVIPNQNQVI